ncbi:recombinase family protein [Litoreibacter halocynthiae]|uniref:recombinase family protein n=1 Tax=Litoreibacter halocynthiae TaxID=1242689 RepID=UPI0024921CE0|nr:recombinase family protein [Litoreibacter halocynthiae]
MHSLLIFRLDFGGHEIGSFNAFDRVSGGSPERPALQRLVQDIEDGLLDQIIVYKIDRLTRSLADSSKTVDTLDAAEASLVSVAQSCTTTTRMGRLTLNMLLTFARLEREVTAERILVEIAPRSA